MQYLTTLKNYPRMISLLEKSTTSLVLDRKVSQYTMHNVIMLSESVKLPEACTLLKKKQTDEILVIDDANRPIGIVTDEDILKRVADSLVNTSRTTVGDIMTFPVIGIKKDQTISNALEIMTKNKIRKLVVLSEDNSVEGLLYKNIIMEQITKSLASRPKQSTLWGVIWNLGMVLQFSGTLMLVPGIVATLHRDTDVATGIFLMSVMLLIAGFIMNSYGEKHPLTARGVAILVFSSFMALVLFGMIPQLYVIDFDTLDSVELFANGFHESAAGFTTGGLSVVTQPEDLPRSFTFYRAYTQFVGGLSFIYLIVTAFYSESKLNKMKGFISGQTLNLRELFSTVTIIFSIYVVIVAILLSYFGERDIMDNFALALSGVSTGGWIPDSQVFHGFTPPEYVIIIVAMILGALPFNFHYAFVRAKFLSANITKEIALYFILLAGFSTVFVLSMDTNPLDSVFNMISASTTTGYATTSLEKLSPIPFSVLVIAMLIGACGFATGGGLKIFRLVSLAQVRYFFHKSSQNKITVSDKKDIIVAAIILGTSILTPLFVANYMASNGYDFQNSFFDAVSAITTVGLSTGTLSIELDPLMKMVFGFLAILGRVEVILLVYMFVPKLMR